MATRTSFHLSDVFASREFYFDWGVNMSFGFSILGSRLVFMGAALGLLTSCSEDTKSDIGQVLDQGSYAFNVHFLVVSDRPPVVLKATEAQMRKEVDILNEYFVTDKREKIVLFVYKDTAFRSDIGTDCQALLDLGNARTEYGDGEAWKTAINGCEDEDIIDPEAINFIVYDSWNSNERFGDIGSHGRRNRNRPYVLIDYARLDHMEQPAEEHEMGHAFGLSHVCVPHAKRKTVTNIMAASKDCAGSGGERNLGFEPDQVQTILRWAEEIREELSGVTSS